MERFYWVREDRLAGSSRPGGLRDDRLDADLIELHERGIGAILSMTETPIDAFAVEAAGMSYAHIPVDDFTAPGVSQIRDALDVIDLAHAEDRAVLVHCAAGQGRAPPSSAPGWSAREPRLTTRSPSSVLSATGRSRTKRKSPACGRSSAIGCGWCDFEVRGPDEFETWGLMRSDTLSS